MSDFHIFAKAVNAQFTKMCKAGDLFVTGNTDVDGQEPANRQHEQVYLQSFPAGTDPIYRVNTEHNCSCCKQFLRNIGPLVSLKDGKITTVWDVEGLPHPYDVVAKAMSEHIRQLPIKHPFLVTERKYGAQSTLTVADGQSKKWNHFWAEVPASYVSPNQASVIGEALSRMQVFRRGLTELSDDAVSTVLQLIADNNLYRGAEFKAVLQAFEGLRTAFKAADNKEVFAWVNSSVGAATIKNTVIGTLLTDLSSGMDAEAAVRAFEAKVAPANYKRPKPMVTQAMVKAAMETITSLGLEESLSRRHATMKDIKITNVLWASEHAKASMGNGLESLLMAEASSPKGKVEGMPISWEEFKASVLPKASKVEVLFKNQHTPNLMALTTEKYEGSKGLFRWPNPFGWSYNGNVTDAIREKVKAAGGNVTTAKLRISLAWYNLDDLDLHVTTPEGDHIYYGKRHGLRSQGKLDVDMNAGRGTTREPVENVSFTSLKDGLYKVSVNQFSCREKNDYGFTLQVASDDYNSEFGYSVPVTGTVNALQVLVRDGKVQEVSMGAGISGSAMSTTVWGLDTETFVPVDTILLSPNHWDDFHTGNLHVFFIANGCKSDMPVRGIYNEFLSPGLEEHRRVFELLGDKSKCPQSESQVSGLGFSSTRKDTVTVRVSGHQNKVYDISF